MPSQPISYIAKCSHLLEDAEKYCLLRRSTPEKAILNIEG